MSLSVQHRSNTVYNAPDISILSEAETQRLLSSTVMSCDTKKLQSLIDQGIDVNAKNEFGDTALYGALLYAKSYHLSDSIELLMDNGADPDLKTREGKSLLYFALSHAPDYIAEMLAKKSDPSKWEEGIVFKALENKLLTTAESLIERGNGTGIHYKDPNGLSCLHLAVRGCSEHGLPTTANILLNLGVDINAKTLHCHTWPSNFTPLHMALENDNDYMVRFLVKRGATLNFPDGPNPLHMAIKNPEKYVNMFLLLVELGADINLQKSNGYHQVLESPLSLAISIGNSYITTTLIEKGCDINAKNAMGRTALFKLIDKKPDHYLLDTMIRHGADLSISDNDNDTVLDAAINKYFYYKTSSIPEVSYYEENLLTFIEMLLDYGAKSRNIKSLFKAVENGKVELVKFLFDREVYSFSDLSPKEIRAVKLLLLKSVELKDPKTLKLQSTLHLYGWCKSTIRFISAAIEKEEEKILKNLLAKRNYTEFHDLTRTIKALKKTGLKDELKKKREELKHFNAPIDQARTLYQQGKIEEAKKLLNVESKVSGRTIVCAYLVSRTCPGSLLEADVYLIIDRLVNSSSLKNMLKFSRVYSLIYEISSNHRFNYLTSEQKMKFLKKISRNHFKNIEELLLIDIFVKLEKSSIIYAYIKLESPLDYLKQKMRKLFENSLDLNGVQDVEMKYENTFGKFRDPAGIFIYAASLSRHNNREQVKQLLSTYVKDVLEGRFLEERYNVTHSDHLKAISETDGGPQLLEVWKKGKEIPLEELCRADGSTSHSKPNYLELFKQKIVTDHHLGEYWQERFPYLSRVLEDNESLEDVIDDLNEDLKIKKGEPTEETLHTITLIEAQKKILILCPPETNINGTLLKELIDFFAGYELQNDIKSLLMALSMENKKTVSYTVCDTDHPCDILSMGQEIDASCQRLDGSADLNCGLLGPLLDGKYRIIAVKNAEGKLVARCLLKVLWDKKLRRPVLFQERLYVNGHRSHHKEALEKMCLEKAQEMNLPLLNSEYSYDSKKYPNAVSSIGGRSSFEYVDALGGVENQVYDISGCTIVWEPTAPL